MIKGIFTAMAVFVMGFATVTMAAGTDPLKLNATVKVYEGDGHGSGVFISQTEILTAAHVVGNSEYVSIKLYEGHVLTARVKWKSVPHDIAMLEVKTAKAPKPQKLACRKSIKPEPITAIGNPTNMEWTSTHGSLRWEPIQTVFVWKQAYVADIMVLPGMSGGPVFDREGKVIAVTVGYGYKNEFGTFSTTLMSIFVPSHTVCQLMMDRKRKGQD